MPRCHRGRGGTAQHFCSSGPKVGLQIFSLALSQPSYRGFDIVEGGQQLAALRCAQKNELLALSRPAMLAALLARPPRIGADGFPMAQRLGRRVVAVTTQARLPARTLLERRASDHPSELGTPLGRRSHWPNGRAPIAFERNAIVHMAELSGIIACRTAKSESAIV
jgi:hypothetical protein